jgi:hypothetical protein
MNKDELQIGDLVTGRLYDLQHNPAHPSIFGSCRLGSVGLVVRSTSDADTMMTYYSVLWFDRGVGHSNPESCEDNEVTKLEIPGED